MTRALLWKGGSSPARQPCTCSIYLEAQGHSAVNPFLYPAFCTGQRNNETRMTEHETDQDLCYFSVCSRVFMVCRRSVCFLPSWLANCRRFRTLRSFPLPLPRPLFPCAREESYACVWIRRKHSEPGRFLASSFSILNSKNVHTMYGRMMYIDFYHTKQGTDTTPTRNLL